MDAGGPANGLETCDANITYGRHDENSRLFDFGAIVHATLARLGRSVQSKSVSQDRKPIGGRTLSMRNRDSTVAFQGIIAALWPLFERLYLHHIGA